MAPETGSGKQGSREGAAVGERPRSSEERHRLAAEAAGFGVYDADLDNGTLYWSPQMWSILGLSPDEAPPPHREIPNFIHADDFDSVSAMFADAFDPDGDGVVMHEHRIVRGDGSIRWVQLRGQVQFAGDGDRRRAVRNSGVVFDITDRKHTESALLASEGKYRTLFNSIDEGFCIVKVMFDNENRATDFRFVEVNHVFEEQTGLKDVIGKTALETVPGTESFWIEISGRVAATGEPLRRVGYMEALGKRWFDMYAFRIADPEQREVALLFRDITERKCQEVHQTFLAEINADFGRLSGPDEIMQIVGAKIGAYLSASSCNFCDVDEANDKVTIGHQWIDAGPHSKSKVYRMSDYVTEEFKNSCRGGEPVIVRDTTADSHTGPQGFARVHVRAFVAIPFHSNGAWRSFLAIADSRPRHWRDDEIHLIRELSNSIFPRLERARTEEALRQSEARLHQVFEQAPVAIAMLREHEFTVELANPQYQSLISGRELVGKRYADVVPELGQGVWDAFHAVLDTGEPLVRNEWQMRYDSNGDGAPEDHWLNVSCHPYRERDNSVSGFIVVASDVTAQVIARQELERVNRELEEFAYVASHDIQEPLRMVNIYTQHIVRHVGSDDPLLTEYGEFVREGVRRMENLIEDLLTYSRSIQREERPVGVANLSAALNEALAVLKDQIDSSGARIEAEDMPMVRGEVSQLAHVFQNLLSNALKYSKPGARPLVRLRVEKNAGEWLIRVEDDGLGFDEQYADRIFGLFKRLHGREYPGTGLGLAICRRIVERYGGRIWARGRLGEGATFYFALPQVD